MRPRWASQSIVDVSALTQATRNSLRGLRHALSTERAVKQEFAVLVVAAPIAFVLSKNAIEFIALIGVILIVIAFELINTAVETLCDRVNSDYDDQIRNTKDVSSAAILCCIVVCCMVWALFIVRFALGLAW